jgi:4-hydroxy-tetrahydrodipicolinate synthase
MSRLSGVYPILNTTFSDDGSIDYASQERLVEHLIEQGAHGLGLFGNASEGYTLSNEERMKLMAAIRKAVNGRVPLVASSGHTGTDAAVELSRQLEGEGADALMVLPPYFLKTDSDGLIYYYDAISKAVRIPIMVQDAPLLTQVAMAPALLARMAKEIEHVEYVKVEAPPTAPKTTAVVNATGGKLAVFGGLNCNFMIEEIERGACGMMPGSDMIRQLVGIWDALEHGDQETAWVIFTRILPLIRFELQPGMGVSAMKNNLKAAGVIKCAKVRHPTVEIDSDSLRELAVLRDRVSR